MIKIAVVVGVAVVVAVVVTVVAVATVNGGTTACCNSVELTTDEADLISTARKMFDFNLCSFMTKHLDDSNEFLHFLTHELPAQVRRIQQLFSTPTYVVERSKQLLSTK